jgi:2-polyprenyl-3-methyl-5-hydroxy-6-metoxy-1,4-benzoquinol methylase
VVCCPSNCYGIDGHFDTTIAARDLRQYQRQGPNKTTALIRDSLSAHGISGATVLDIGAGIGTLSFELLRAGASRAVGIDLSPAYVEVAQAEASRQRMEAAFRVGDFVDVANELTAADIVVLDRVICCYPHAEPLLNAATERSRRLFALSYPKDRWDVRTVLAFDNLKRRLKSETFRSFVHDPLLLQRVIERSGFRRVARSQTFVWRVDTFIRMS